MWLERDCSFMHHEFTFGGASVPYLVAATCSGVVLLTFDVP